VSSRSLPKRKTQGDLVKGERYMKVEFRSAEMILPTPVLKLNTAPIDGDARLLPSLEYMRARGDNRGRKRCNLYSWCVRSDFNAENRY
jgi:hypothetical protein